MSPDEAHDHAFMPAQTAATQAHELVHSAMGIMAGQGKSFKRIALGLGLVGPMRATSPGPPHPCSGRPRPGGGGSLTHAPP